MSLPRHIRLLITETPPIQHPKSECSSKPNALFIGYAPHQKTLSSNFFIDILSRAYNVYTASLPSCDISLNCDIRNLPNISLVVLFQVTPSASDIRVKFPTARIVACPMADYFYTIWGRNEWLWNEYREVEFISFSKAVHDNLVSSGFRSTFVQYFPKPNPNAHPGFTDQAFLWYRLPVISAETVLHTLETFHLRHLHVHNVRDYEFKSPPTTGSYPFDISYSTWFTNKDEMLKTIERSALYFAPRHMEGIGMSYLEAMAMGRCVIAPNATTMNEYITDGETGYLYDLTNPSPILGINENTIRTIQSNTLDYMSDGYNRWLKTERDLLDLL